jgi:YHS domain-containing protein
MIHKLRILIVILAINCNTGGFSQTYSQLISFADQKVQERDYYYAIQFYEQAMDIDSNSVEVLWKYAETLRMYKDFPKAEYYYKKVYRKEDAKIYPRSIFWLGTMQHYNGKYKEAIATWKKAKKIYKRDRDSYEYLKSLHEIKSCLWASKAIRDTSKHIVKALDAPVNTENAEFAPVIHNDKIYYTSLKADSINLIEEIFTEEYTLQIYTAEQEDSMFNNVDVVKNVVKKDWNSANGSFSPDGTRFYFSRCNSSYDCKIFVAKVDGDKIYDVDSLGEIINEPGYISTMPHCTMIDGQEILFFSSTINKNFGGFDIWYSKITNGNQYALPKNITTINTADDEISPFYDTVENKLYFSSNWHSGFGGQDIFWVKNNDWKFEDPVNVGLPLNSNKNDTYFFIDQKTKQYYFSSNRDGVKFAKNPNCCNDIFSAYLPTPKPPTRFETLNDLNKKLPVKLYFHNDEPNPRTRDTVSTLTYMEAYNAYEAMKKKYKKEYSHGLSGEEAEEAKEDIEDFFIEYVEQGVIDLKEFLRLLVIELDKGYEIEVTIKGFASPLAKTDYNVPLTKRRISSLMSYLEEYDNGILNKYLKGVAENGGHLTFVKIPFGEYTADQLISDNPNDAQNSVYSRKAALERKIEIQSVSLVTQDSSYAKMKFGKQAHDFGASVKGSILTYEFCFTNNGDETLEIGEIEADCDCLSFELTKSVFEPGESGKILLTWDTSNRSGITFSHLTINSNIKAGKKQLTLTSEIK